MKKTFLLISMLICFVYLKAAAEDNNEIDKILQYENFDLSTEALINLYSKTRSLYWIFLAAKNGDCNAKITIEKENLKLESSYSILVEDICNKEDSMLSDYEIKILTDYALRGGGKEAYRLYEYYQNYKHNETEAVYWLRIGAQNFNDLSQYEYGKYLLAAEDENNNIRGSFWIKKSCKKWECTSERSIKKIRRG